MHSCEHYLVIYNNKRLTSQLLCDLCFCSTVLRHFHIHRILGGASRMWTSNFLMGNGHTSHCDRFAGHIWRSKWYIKPPTLLCFCSIYIIYECSHGLQVGDSCFGVLQFLTLSQDRSGLVSTHIQLSSPVTGLDRPRGFQEVKVPRFYDNGTGWW